MEKRSSLRRPIHHEAMLKLEGSKTWPCIIADYCSEGMLINYGKDVSILLKSYTKMSPNADFTLTFTGQKGEQHELKAKFMHMMECAAGIQFTGRYDQAVQALLEFKDSHRKEGEPKGKVKQIIQECVSCIKGHIQPLMHDFYPVVVQEIKTFAVTASSDQLANSIMEAANKIGREQGSLQQAFLMAIEDPMSIVESKMSRGEEVADRLSLIEKGEFEDWLISRVLITKTETNFRSQLLPLKMRLDAIGISDKRHHQSPFGPALLVSAFQSSLSRLTMGGVVEKIVFRCFEQQVIAHLEPLYEELNELLIRHKILPDIDLSKLASRASTSTPVKTKKPIDSASRKEQQTTELNTSVSAESNEQPMFGYGAYGMQPPFQAPSFSAESHSVHISQPPFSLDSESAPMTQDIGGSFKQNQQQAAQAFQNVLGLVKSLRSNQNYSRTSQGIPVPTQHYSESELSESLSDLQVSVAEETGDIAENQTGLLERVQSSLASQNADGEQAEVKGIHEEQQVAIDVVDRFFASMRKNPRISEEAKQHLLKLEVPVLKVLLKDDRFFDDRNSSVRAVMNRIAQLGATGSRMSPSARKKLDSLIQIVLQEFEHDTEVFDRVLKEMDALLERQNQLYVKNVERVATAAEGVHKVEEAKVAVAKALNKRLKEHSVPPAVLTLIENGWQDWLSFIHIKKGEGSDEWEEALSVIDELIAYGENPEKTLDIKYLLPKIQSGLKSVSGNEEPPIIIREALKQLVNSGPTGEQECVQAELRDIPETESEVVRRNTKTSQALKHWIVRAKSVLPGTWVQFNREDNSSYYMRLVWVAKGYSKFVFVNHQGMKVIELGLFKFSSHLKDKRIIPDTDYEVPIVNQSLDDMVKDVYDKLAYEASHDTETGVANKREFCREVRDVMRHGNRTAECLLFYCHFELLEDDENPVLPENIGKSVVSVLSELKAASPVPGRVNSTDFVLFIVMDELGISNTLTSENFAELLKTHPNLRLVIGESRAHLGFNNPELMIEHALKSMQDKLSALNSVPAIQSESVSEEVDQIAEEIPLITDDMLSIGENVGEEHVDSSQNFAEEFEAYTTPVEEKSTEKLLEIYGQKTLPVSEKAAYGIQYDLVCSEQGSGISFEPEDEEVAGQLDRWWLNQLVLKKENNDPAWDTINAFRVKLSGYAFKDDSFKDELLLLVESGQIDADNVWFDLYDCSSIENIHAAADMMKHMIMKGFRFCLDHFGTNRSPFALLKVLPVDMIKIDESFMSSMNEDDADESEADSIVEVAHYLGKEVIANSVDTAICFQRMKKLGVDYAQGATIEEYFKLEVPLSTFSMD